jgi:hypothetical protein
VTTALLKGMSPKLPGVAMYWRFSAAGIRFLLKIFSS